MAMDGFVKGLENELGVSETTARRIAEKIKTDPAKFRALLDKHVPPPEEAEQATPAKK
jgi:Trp operon repressor